MVRRRLQVVRRWHRKGKSAPVAFQETADKLNPISRGECPGWGITGLFKLVRSSPSPGLQSLAQAALTLDRAVQGCQQRGVGTPEFGVTAGT